MSTFLYLLDDSILSKGKGFEFESTEQKLPTVFEQEGEIKLYNAKRTPVDK